MVATIELYSNNNADYIVVTIPDVWFCTADNPANKVMNMCSAEHNSYLPSQIMLSTLSVENKKLIRALLAELLHNYSYNVASKNNHNFSTMGLMATNELLYGIVEQEDYFLHFRLTK